MLEISSTRSYASSESLAQFAIAIAAPLVNTKMFNFDYLTMYKVQMHAVSK